eukprot:2996399-Karenia_brevis.AAC.1
MPTVDGDPYFSIYDMHGTSDDSQDATRFHVQNMTEGARIFTANFVKNSSDHKGLTRNAILL